MFIPFEKPEGEISLEDALTHVKALQSTIGSTGAGDSEYGNLNTIIDSLEKGEIKPNDAVDQARKIISERQDYR